jgi:ATP-dependent DNA helicase RecG
MNRLPALDEVPTSLGEINELLQLLGGPSEHEALDFKRDFRKEDQRHLAAMSMTDGGLLVLGVDDDGHLVGRPLTPDLRDLIAGVAQDIGIEVSLREIAVGRDKITLVAVPEVRGRIVTTTDGRLLRRVGAASRPLVGDGLARFVRERTVEPAEEDVVPVFDPRSIDIDSLNAVLDAAGRAPARSVEDLVQSLVDLGVAERIPNDPRGSVVRMAAVIAFSRDPTALVPGARVQFVRRDGRQDVDAPVTRRETFTGPVVEVIEAVVASIVEELPRYESIIGLRRTEAPVIPLSAIREVIVNAVAHRDYGLRNATVDVTVTDDALTVQSPGPLPGHVTVANIRDEHYSRNPRLMALLRTAGLVEEFGDGVDRIFDDMAERLLPEPIYVATSSSVSVTLRTTTSLRLEDQVWLSTLSDVALSRDDRRVLLEVRATGQITRRAVRQLPVDAEPERLLRSMVQRGLLEPRGRRGGRFYVLSPEVRARSGDSSILAEQARRQLVEDELRRRGPQGLSTREAADALGDRELTGARSLLNELVRSGVAEARGKTSGRRFFVR